MAKGGPSPSQGTGFFVSRDGFVITNYHVIEGHNVFTARAHTGAEFKVIGIVAVDKEHDLALLKLSAKQVNAVALDVSDSVRAGQAVVVIGNPLGLESTVSEGIVSALRSLEGADQLIQITAPISPGSSGSPVLNEQGKVIGVAVLKFLQGESLNFAIPSRHVSDLMARGEAAKTVDSRAGLYVPNRTAVTSAEEDKQCAIDVDFIALKEAEAKAEYFAMLGPARRLSKRYANSALAARALSDALCYAELIEESVVEAKRAIDLDPNSARGWNNLAILHNAMGEYDNADAVYRHAIKLAPDDAKLLIEYAELQTVSSQAGIAALNHARSLLSKGLGVDHETSRYDLGSQLVLAYLANGSAQLAFDTALELVKREGNSASLWLAAAEAARSLGKYTHARSALERAMSVDKNVSGIAYHIYGDTLRDEGWPEAAVTAYRRALVGDTRNTSILVKMIGATLDKRILLDADIEAVDAWLTHIQNLDDELGKEVRKIVVQRLRLRR